jgi:hypothetical protein
MGDLEKRINALRNINNRVEPNQAWVNATRRTLLMQAKNSLAGESVQTTKTIRYFYQYFVPVRFLQVVRGPVLAVLSIFAVVLGVSSASVSAAERSLPGDFLYSLKLVTEQARLAWTSDKGEKLKLKVEFATRRSQDLKQIANSGSSEAKTSERVQKAAEILKRDLSTVQEQLEDVRAAATEPGEAVAAAKLVDQTSNELVQVLQATKSSLSQETQDKVTEAQAAAAGTVVKALEVMVEQHEESDQSIAQTEVMEAIEYLSKTVASATGGSTIVSATSSILIAATGTAPLPPTLKDVLAQTKEATLQAFAAVQPANLFDVSSTQPIEPSATSTLEAPNQTTTSSATP